MRKKTLLNQDSESILMFISSTLLRIIFFTKSHEQPVLIKTAYGLDQYYL